MALERWAPSDELFAHLIRMNFLCACTVLLRRSLFTCHGLHDASVEPADDYDMWLRCQPQASLGYVPEPLAEYVLHDENHSWRATPMHEAAIRVLLRTYDRCAGDEQRREAFGRTGGAPCAAVRRARDPAGRPTDRGSRAAAHPLRHDGPAHPAAIVEEAPPREQRLLSLGQPRSRTRRAGDPT